MRAWTGTEQFRASRAGFAAIWLSPRAAAPGIAAAAFAVRLAFYWDKGSRPAVGVCAAVLGGAVVFLLASYVRSRRMRLDIDATDVIWRNGLGRSAAVPRGEIVAAHRAGPTDGSGRGPFVVELCDADDAVLLTLRAPQWDPETVERIVRLLDLPVTQGRGTVAGTVRRRADVAWAAGYVAILLVLAAAASTLGVLVPSRQTDLGRHVRTPLPGGAPDYAATGPVVRTCTALFRLPGMEQYAASPGSAAAVVSHVPLPAAAAALSCTARRDGTPGVVHAYARIDQAAYAARLASADWYGAGSGGFISPAADATISVFDTGRYTVVAAFAA